MSSAAALFPYSMQHIFSYLARLEKLPEVIGPVPEGILVNFYVAGGEVHGPSLNGKFRHVGGDWFTIRTDGVGLPNVRTTIQSDDGALIYMAYSGVMDLGPEGYQNFLQQKLAPSASLYAAPRFHTANPKYEWMNRVQCVGIGEVNVQQMKVSLDVYSLT
jgi:hypothetical protein